MTKSLHASALPAKNAPNVGTTASNIGQETVGEKLFAESKAVSLVVDD